ncbi:uncharacterized protein LOC113517060 [Galleria mellonella]|uniref:Uncharacterized protein LOC113517060 n=1 Tax=Galleria mellonella TaxID=7137 RepID=A0A6J3BVN4_GALME|nr:uncharacterized protein LOC113517060 [Galleria mellonella]
MSNMRQIESMLFNYETTSRTDFRDGEITPAVKTEYKKKPTCLTIRTKPLKYVHTLVDWKVPNVPFGLMTKPKDIVRTNPREVQVSYEKPPDPVLEEVKRTRPRLVMTPAVSFDDLDDATRKLLLDDVYTTSTMKAMRGVVANATYSSVRTLLPGFPAKANPIVLQKLLPPYVSPEWRMDSVGWDSRQLRTHCDPNKEFWLAKTAQCQEYNDTAEDEEK